MKKSVIRIVLTYFLLAGFQFQSYSQEILPELKNSINLVKKSWNILDETRQIVWPQWQNYKEISYFTAVPLKQDLLINPPTDPKNGYISISTSSDSLMVFLREPGLKDNIWGGAYRYEIDGKRYKGVQFHPQSFTYSKKAFQQFTELYHPEKDSLEIKTLYYSENFYKRIIIHEAFHLFQFKIAGIKAANKNHPSSFSPDEAFQNLANREGEILEKAFNLSNPDTLRKLIRSFLLVREERRKYLTQADIDWEKRNEFVEGCAMYVETKVFEISDKSYWDLLKTERSYQIRNSPKLIADEEMANNRCYFWGMVQAYILDNLYGPEWKKEIMKEGIYFEDLLARTVY